jgi:antitoxin component HigA of HigAB toxin-antitoxin module
MNREAAEHIVDEYTKAVTSRRKKRDAEMLRECLIEHLVLRPSEPTKASYSIKIHEPVQFVVALVRAYEAGKVAYEKGLPCEPSLDEEVLDMRMYLTVEQSGKLMQKWRDGWDEAQKQYHAPYGQT